MRAVHMRTDYLKEPVGLGNPTPRLYWKCEGGVTQSAYQVIAEKDGEQIWDSGKVSSASGTHLLPISRMIRRASMSIELNFKKYPSL